MSENTKNKEGFSVFFGRMACKEVILKTLKATQGLDADVIAEKIQEALREDYNHCIDDYDVLVMLQDLGEEHFISFIDAVVLDCECNSYDIDFRQNLVNKLSEELPANEEIKRELAEIDEELRKESDE